MSIIMCGPGEASPADEKAIRLAVEDMSRAGYLMRRNINHWPIFGRTEGGAYTIECSCGWADFTWHGQTTPMIRAFQAHQAHPEETP